MEQHNIIIIHLSPTHLSHVVNDAMNESSLDMEEQFLYCPCMYMHVWLAVCEMMQAVTLVVVCESLQTL